MEVWMETGTPRKLGLHQSDLTVKAEFELILPSFVCSLLRCWVRARKMPRSLLREMGVPMSNWQGHHAADSGSLSHLPGAGQEG